MPDIEAWRPAPGFPLYEVSNLGAVRSVPRVTRIGQHRRGKVLSQRIDGYGYWVVTLYVEGRKPRPYRVHRIVADAFLGPRPAWADTRHGPGGRLDNRVVNLSYGTRAENENDKKRDGTFYVKGHMPGEANPNSRLTAQAVLGIRQQYAAGAQQVTLAEEYGVTQATISRVVLKQTWKHLP